MRKGCITEIVPWEERRGHVSFKGLIDVSARNDSNKEIV